MSAPHGQPTSAGTEAHDYEDTCYRNHCGADEPYDWDSPRWRTFFAMVADRIRAVANPSSVLDVGCGRGLLVQAFCEQGVDAYGIDASQHAIETAHPNVATRLSLGTAEEIDGSWDLITCIEVLEHMAPAAVEQAIHSMCAASDRVIVSFTPSNFSEAAHISVREPAAWAGSFAERGLFRRTDVDLSFLAPWAPLFERADVTKRDLVYRYEHCAYPLRIEVLEGRAALLDAHRKITELERTGSGSAVGSSDLQSRLDDLQSRLDERNAANLDLRHELLTSRDQAIGAEAEAAQWRLRYKDAVAEPDTAYSSTTRRMGRAIIRRIAKSAGKQR
jgi:SAM-dependent methyltransferase